MDQMRTKDALVMQLTERLEAAAEQLDRLQRSGADKVRPGGGGGGGSRELFEQTGQLTSRVEEALECWNQSSGHYEFILQRLDEISQHIFISPEGGGGARPAGGPTPGGSGPSHSGGSSAAPGAAQGGSFWERMKASMVDGTPAPPMPNAKPVQDNYETQDVESDVTDESIAEQLAAIEQVTPAPTVIDVETASIEELRVAVTTRDEYLSALIKEFRQIQIMPALPEDFENSGLAPAELLTSLKELETRFKTGIQRENFELSLERARMGRERSRLDQVKAQLEGQIKRLAASVGDRSEAPAATSSQPAEPSIAEGKLSWLKRLQPKKPQG